MGSLRLSLFLAGGIVFLQPVPAIGSCGLAPGGAEAPRGRTIGPASNDQVVAAAEARGPHAERDCVWAPEGWTLLAAKRDYEWRQRTLRRLERLFGPARPPFEF